ncbi:hypothetical protein BJ138DRAFT_1128182 [Hygrophoropsis aurantiaca]|uniref:Uncharacterized protein n=1 Tax=Hygrophoropsis aurantiaca TaxID=72124 RepID=A0ACB8A6E2_9AGAM|nr:hypothetical protein BJ138DRAFT_1128182 [Hygrophoropsis aurantiaca]
MSSIKFKVFPFASKKSSANLAPDSAPSAKKKFSIPKFHATKKDNAVKLDDMASIRLSSSVSAPPSPIDDVLDCIARLEADMVDSKAHTCPSVGSFRQRAKMLVSNVFKDAKQTVDNTSGKLSVTVKASHDGCVDMTSKSAMSVEDKSTVVPSFTTDHMDLSYDDLPLDSFKAMEILVARAKASEGEAHVKSKHDTADPDLLWARLYELKKSADEVIGHYPSSSSPSVKFNTELIMTPVAKSAHYRSADMFDFSLGDETPSDSDGGDSEYFSLISISTPGSELTAGSIGCPSMHRSLRKVPKYDSLRSSIKSARNFANADVFHSTSTMADEYDFFFSSTVPKVFESTEQPGTNVDSGAFDVYYDSIYSISEYSTTSDSSSMFSISPMRPLIGPNLTQSPLLDDCSSLSSFHSLQPSIIDGRTPSSPIPSQTQAMAAVNDTPKRMRTRIADTFSSESLPSPIKPTHEASVRLCSGNTCPKWTISSRKKSPFKFLEDYFSKRTLREAEARFSERESRFPC